MKTTPASISVLTGLVIGSLAVSAPADRETRTTQRLRIVPDAASQTFAMVREHASGDREKQATFQVSLGEDGKTVVVHSRNSGEDPRCHILPDADATVRVYNLDRGTPRTDPSYEGVKEQEEWSVYRMRRGQRDRYRAAVMRFAEGQTRVHLTGVGNQPLDRVSRLVLHEDLDAVTFSYPGISMMDLTGLLAAIETLRK